jgi:hypothetical protein
MSNETMKCNFGCEHDIYTCDWKGCDKDSRTEFIYHMPPPFGSLNASHPANVCQTHLDELNKNFLVL